MPYPIAKAIEFVLGVLGGLTGLAVAAFLEAVSASITAALSVAAVISGMEVTLGLLSDALANRERGYCALMPFALVVPFAALPILDAWLRGFDVAGFWGFAVCGVLMFVGMLIFGYTLLRVTRGRREAARS